MTTHCYNQVRFSFQRKLVVDFAGGTITSDAGLLLVRELDARLGLTADVARRVQDSRDSRYVSHDMATLLRQRIYQIAAGYDDANDADRLRLDPTFKLIAGGGTGDLGSQPTISRLENELDWSSIARLSAVGMDWFCCHAYGKTHQPEEILLDVDSTDDPTHGDQQLALFTGFYNQTMYHPLCWFEAHTGLLLRTRLRPGRDQSPDFLVEDLEHIVPQLKYRFPKSRLMLRADAGMGKHHVLSALEHHQIEYVLGIAPNAAFHKKIRGIAQKAQKRYDRTKQPVEIYTSFWYRAKRARKSRSKECREPWSRRRRILLRLRVGATGLDVRFMVTNRSGKAKDLVEWYQQRGTCENRIKELKLDMHADRLSCHRYRANAVRLQLHTIALLLLSYFRRRAMQKTALANATVGTLRLCLFKVAGRVVYTARRIWFHVASYWPWQTLFCRSYRAVAKAPT